MNYDDGDESDDADDDEDDDGATINMPTRTMLRMTNGAGVHVLLFPRQRDAIAF